MADLIRRSGFNLRDYTPARVSLPTTGPESCYGEVLELSSLRTLRLGMRFMRSWICFVRCTIAGRVAGAG